MKDVIKITREQHFTSWAGLSHSFQPRSCGFTSSTSVMKVDTGGFLPVVWENGALRKWDTIYFESALTGQQGAWSFQLQGYVPFRFLNRKSAITQPLGQLHLPRSFKMALCQQIFMRKTTNTDEGNQCSISSAVFFARNCFCGSCAAVMPPKSFPIQGGLRPCCWDRGCVMRGGPTAGEMQ